MMSKLPDFIPFSANELLGFSSHWPLLAPIVYVQPSLPESYFTPVSPPTPPPPYPPPLTHSHPKSLPLFPSPIPSRSTLSFQAIFLLLSSIFIGENPNSIHWSMVTDRAKIPSLPQHWLLLATESDNQIILLKLFKASNCVPAQAECHGANHMLSMLYLLPSWHVLSLNIKSMSIFCILECSDGHLVGSLKKLNQVLETTCPNIH